MWLVSSNPIIRSVGGQGFIFQPCLGWLVETTKNKSWDGCIPPTSGAFNKGTEYDHEWQTTVPIFVSFFHVKRYTQQAWKNTARLGKITALFVEGAVDFMDFWSTGNVWSGRTGKRFRQVSVCGWLTCWRCRSYDPRSSDLFSFLFACCNSDLWVQQLINNLFCAARWLRIWRCPLSSVAEMRKNEALVRKWREKGFCDDSCRCKGNSPQRIKIGPRVKLCSGVSDAFRFATQIEIVVGFNFLQKMKHIPGNPLDCFFQKPGFSETDHFFPI